MVELTGPADVTQISVEQENFTVNENGNFAVPEVFVSKLVDIGFKRVPARIRVSREAADAIAKSAKELNLPTPPISIDDSPAARAANLAKITADAKAANVPPLEGDRINGSPREVVEAASIADPIERKAALDALAEKARDERAADAAAQEVADAAKAKETTGAGEGGAGKGEADPKTE